MSRGSQNPPYRLPCGGTVLCGNGPRYQHARASEQNIPVYLYNTEVCNWSECEDCPSLDGTTPCNGYTDCPCGMIGPYTRYAEATPDAPCSSPCPDPCEEPPCQPCGPWNYSAEYPAPTPSFYQPQMLTAATLVDGGSGYMVGQVLGPTGGTTSNYIHQFDSESNDANLTVTGVDGSGAITAFEITQRGSYQTVPSNAVSFPGTGHGTGATFNLTWTGQLENMSPCFKYGFKNVQARRQWHGQPGFLFNSNPVLVDCRDGNYTVYEGYLDTATQTKYTTIECSCSQSEEGSMDNCLGGTMDVSYSASASYTNTVDPNTGIITQTEDMWDETSQCGTDSCGGPYYHEWVLQPNLLVSEALSLTISGCISNVLYQAGQGGWSLDYIDITGGQASSPDEPTGGYVYFTASDSEISYTTIFNTNNYPDFMGTVTTTLTATLSGSNTASSIQSDITTLLDEWDLTNDTEYPWRTDGYTSIAPIVSRDEVQGNVMPSSLGGPISTEIDDCNGYAPGDGGYQATNSYAAAVDSNAGLYDGSIVGAPLPAGYQGTFDFNYVDFQWCATGGEPGNTCEIGSDPSYFYIYGYGAYVQSSPVPLNATQWTDNATASGLPGGAWIFYNCNPSYTGTDNSGDSCFTYGPNDCCMAQKWAETKMGWASQNFARPGGMDRFDFDETQVYNISATTNGTDISTIGPGSQITLEQTPNCGGVTIADSSGVWGGPAVNGFYEIVSVAGSVVTLGELIYNVPSNWESAAAIYNSGTETWSSDNAYCFGKLRFSTGVPSTDPAAILGRAGISAVAEYESNPDVSELTMDTLTTLGMPPPAIGYDTVDIYDSNMNLLSGNLQVTRIDDSHFTVPVVPGTLAGAAWIMTHGAPAYYWDDQYPKGDYAYTDWTWWPRQIGAAALFNINLSSCEGSEGCDCSPLGDTLAIPAFPLSGFTQSAGCLAFNPCSPAVLCISPNGEAFANGDTYGFATIQFDEQYGSGWQAEIQQVMQDLLYQTPHYPAQGPDCTDLPYDWTEDNGSCNTSLCKYCPFLVLGYIG
jgi:hypothetical protein